MSVCVCVCSTLKPTVLRRGYGGGTCLRQVVFYQKIIKLTHLDHVFGASFCSFALNLKRSVIKKWSKTALEHTFCSFAANLKRSVQKVFPSQHRFLDPSYTIAPKGATLPCRCILVRYHVRNTDMNLIQLWSSTHTLFWSSWMDKLKLRQLVRESVLFLMILYSDEWL